MSDLRHRQTHVALRNATEKVNTMRSGADVESDQLRVGGLALELHASFH